MRIVIKVIIKTKKGGYIVRVLVDSGIEVNYIKKRLALEISILIIVRVIPLVVLDKG